MAEPETVEPTKETLEDKFPDVDMPHLEAVIQLLYHTGNEIKDIEFIDPTPYVRVEVGGEEWFIMNMDEVNDYIGEEVESLFDASGMEMLNLNWLDFIINRDDFTKTLAEDIQAYIDSVREEPPLDPTNFTSRLDEEMAEGGAANEEEFEDYLTSQWVPDGDIIAWYIEKYGEDAFKDLADVDYELLAKHLIETDGRGSVIAKNGEEVDLGKGYYAYRLD